MSSRSRSREIALQILYQMELNQQSPEQTLTEYHHHFRQETTDDTTFDFAAELVRRCCTERAPIDAAIAAASVHWKLERMGKLDVSVIRLATTELLFYPETPKNVALNEAIELARRFCSAEAPPFINGVLDHVARNC